MGYTVHDAIVASSVFPDKTRAILIGAGVEFLETGGGLNGFTHFFVPSSGSKSGWEEEERHTEKMRALVKELGESCEWARVQYGFDPGHAEVTDHGCR